MLRRHLTAALLILITLPIATSASAWTKASKSKFTKYDAATMEAPADGVIRFKQKKYVGGVRWYSSVRNMTYRAYPLCMGGGKVGGITVKHLGNGKLKAECSVSSSSFSAMRHSSRIRTVSFKNKKAALGPHTTIFIDGRYRGDDATLFCLGVVKPDGHRQVIPGTIKVGGSMCQLHHKGQKLFTTEYSLIEDRSLPANGWVTYKSTSYAPRPFKVNSPGKFKAIPNQRKVFGGSIVLCRARSGNAWRAGYVAYGASPKCVVDHNKQLSSFSVYNNAASGRGGFLGRERTGTPDPKKHLVIDRRNGKPVFVCRSTNGTFGTFTAGDTKCQGSDHLGSPAKRGKDEKRVLFIERKPGSTGGRA